MLLTNRERRLCEIFRDLPERFDFRYTEEASKAVQQALFLSLVGENEVHLRRIFKGKIPSSAEFWSLRDAQGLKEGAEYTEAARGKPCGHIFKNGEATYRCRTCTLDDTCVLCSRCFDASDHTGHLVNVSISPGNTGCCDCGDLEAWRIPVHCTIHDPDISAAAGKRREGQSLPEELMESARMTIARAIDYMCDVISCSPEQLRLQKTEESIRQDERLSHLASKWYEEVEDLDPEFALILWNDEKHTIDEVKTQVARACRERSRFGLDKANETNDFGRSVIKYSKDIQELLKTAKIIEDIKITVTIRSSRDTFREQMCGTIIEWLVDIAGCSLGENDDTLRRIICEEFLKTWRTGSAAANSSIGKEMDDHEIDESFQMRRHVFAHASRRDALAGRLRLIETTLAERNADRNDDMDDDDGDDDTDSQANEDEMEIDMEFLNPVDEGVDPDIEMRTPIEPEDETEVSEATYAGYPPPPPPPPPGPQIFRLQSRARAASEADNEQIANSPMVSKANIEIPKTPFQSRRNVKPRPPGYWLEQPESYASRSPLPLHEDLRQRVRLDWMILFDLRLWKKARVDLRDLYISTVVNIPQFKRILGLRFAGLYTVLAQLYLVADREPDHSIINLSLQMLTTPSITEEIVERGNFLTNLMSILYTFLTTRQVGHPWEMSSTATLAFDAGSVANRRMAHFFQDLHYLLGCDYVQEQLRTEERYVLQLLDLIKLPQGICPNVRAVGDHVEYETDAWISASLLTREINRLCRQFADSFRHCQEYDLANLCRVIRIVAKATVINSMGAERIRFDQAELKAETRFKLLEPYLFDVEYIGYDWKYSVVDFVVEREHISFHHALHYTLSWLIDCGKSMSLEHVKRLLYFSSADLQSSNPSRVLISVLEPEDYLMALFDIPLRVCVWLSQMKAGIWVRNGLSLRHQMLTYRGVQSRDLAHHRDIFLLQTAMVTCDPSRVLASMIERFGLDDWIRGRYIIRAGYEPGQQLDVAEDFLHLLIILLSERITLLPVANTQGTQALAIRRDIAHILCFKPLSFSLLTDRLSEKFQVQEEFQEILDEMTNFRAPEGLSDTGTFELKPEYLLEIDPYIAHYSKNQRDEAENVYRTWMAKRTGQAFADVVLEPKLQPIESGLFANLSAFTSTPLFVQIIYYSLWQHMERRNTHGIPNTRIEAYLHVVLHLTLISVGEDRTDEEDQVSRSSFCRFALKGVAPGNYSSPIFNLLVKMLDDEDIKGCHARIRLILHRLRQHRPNLYRMAVNRLRGTAGTAAYNLLHDRLGTESPQAPPGEDSETKQRQMAEAKKRQALDRQAKVMAQFQQAQQNFLKNQESIDWGDDELDDADSVATGATEEHRKMWKYPTGNCILCQEETNDSRLYGTFAMIMKSNIVRQTDLCNADIVKEVISVPASLDRSAEEIRPFGIAGMNRNQIRKITAQGEEITSEHQGLGKGFSSDFTVTGPVSTGCGHIMHYSCFELYCGSAERRQSHQIARNHPERLKKKEFVCPLCKALGNAFLPIIWRGKEEIYPGALEVEMPFDDWLNASMGLSLSRWEKRATGTESSGDTSRYQELFTKYTSKTVIPPIANRLLARSQQPSFMPSAIHTDEGESPSPVWPPTPNSLLEELMSVYGRLKATIENNELFNYDEDVIPVPDLTEGLKYSDTLSQALGFSIAATEIAQRGIQSEPGMTLLDKIPAMTLTHLRMVSETASSYVAIGSVQESTPNVSIEKFHDKTRRQLWTLFGGHPQMSEVGPQLWKDKMLPSALSHDPFIFLTDCSIYLAPALDIEIHQLLRLCYILELVRLVFNMHEPVFDTTTHTIQTPLSRVSMFTADDGGASSSESVQALKVFWTRLADFNQDAAAKTPATPVSIGMPIIQARKITGKTYAAIVPYALTFLRKAVILLHVRYGVDFPDTGFADMDRPEIDRLSRALRLPPLPELLASVGKTVSSGLTVTQAVVSGWVRHWYWTAALSEGTIDYRIRPSHPAIFELIGLPKNYDTLTHEAMRRRCPTTGKDLVDPALCLFCGDIFCSQAICCHKNKKGGCSQHMEK